MMLTLFLAQIFAQNAIADQAVEKPDVKKESGESIFNGKTLEGWEGNPKLWSVEDGIITGRTTSDTKLKANTFLIWQGGDVDDFELRLQYRTKGGNSGVQYRSRVLDPKTWRVVGYQADIDSSPKYTGILYEEGGRGILTKRGERTTITKNGKRETKAVANAADLQKSIHATDWNDYLIEVKGNVLRHSINGKLMSETIDADEKKRASKGVLALQLHRGPAMTIQFRNIYLKKLGEKQTEPVKANVSPASLPVVVDMRPQIDAFGFTPGHQGERLTCTLFTLTFISEYQWALTHSIDQPQQFSQEFLVRASNEACNTETDSGMTYEIIHALNEFGICRNELLAYESTFDSNAKMPIEAVEDASHYRGWQPVWMKHWDVTTGLSDAQLLATKAELANGFAVNAGMRWPKDPKLSEEFVLNTPSVEKVRDGHSVAIVGYKDDANQPGGGLFIFRNSYGPEWGDQGYGYITYDYAKRYINNVNVMRVDRYPNGTPRRDHRIRFEAEALLPPVTDGESEVVTIKKNYADIWSNRKYLKTTGSKLTSTLLKFEVAKADTYRIDLNYTVGPDMGRVQAFVDSKPMGKPFEGMSGRYFPSGPVTIGEMELAAGSHELELRVVGKHTVSTGCAIGIDAIDLLPATIPIQ